MMRSNRKGILAFVVALGIATAVQGLIVAQDATPGGRGGEQSPPEWAKVVATGLMNPRDMVIAPDGAIFVAESGVGGEGPCVPGPTGAEECFGATGAVTRLAGGATERVVDGLASRAAFGSDAIGPTDVGLDGDTLYVLIGLAGNPAMRQDVDAGAGQFGYLMRAEDGQVTPVADVAGYEAAQNPAGGGLDANPYDLVTQNDGSFLVVDAAMNALLRVAADGTISTLAVFPDRLVTAPDGSRIPMNSVPTSIVTAPDGSYLVGELTGVPYPPGAARIYRVPAGGGEPTVAYDGFTNIIDLALGPDGSLYVLEFSADGMRTMDPEDPSTLNGRLIRIHPDGNREEIASEGLILPTGLAVDTDGTIYVAVYGTRSDQGQIWQIASSA